MMDNFFKILKIYPPASKASREVVNLTERKNPHTPVYGVKEFVCLSVCLLPKSTPIIWPPIKLNSQGSELKKILNRPILGRLAETGSYKAPFLD